jgi:hypothetical protein
MVALSLLTMFCVLETQQAEYMYILSVLLHFQIYCSVYTKKEVGMVANNMHIWFDQIRFLKHVEGTEIIRTSLWIHMEHHKQVESGNELYSNLYSYSY